MDSSVIKNKYRILISADSRYILRAYPQINKSDIIVPKAGDNNDREEKLSIMDHIR